jgi:general secretion pathway protein G
MKNNRGFTLLELMVVVVVLGILFGIASFAVSGRLTYAKETALKQNLATMRKAIDDYYSDKKAYPSSLNDLVNNKYIRKVPEDPFTKSDTSWEIISSDKGNDVSDVKSGSSDIGADGKAYREW